MWSLDDLRSQILSMSGGVPDDVISSLNELLGRLWRLKPDMPPPDVQNDPEGWVSLSWAIRKPEKTLVYSIYEEDGVRWVNEFIYEDGRSSFVENPSDETIRRNLSWVMS